MQIFRNPDLYIAKSPLEGSGVFTSVALPTNTLLEVCPVIIMPGKDRALIDDTHLYNYYFLWGEDESMLCICLGWGSLFNHSFASNVHYHMHYDNNTISFFTIEPVRAGQELFINYNGDPNDTTPLWFDVE